MNQRTLLNWFKPNSDELEYGNGYGQFTPLDIHNTNNKKKYIETPVKNSIFIKPLFDDESSDDDYENDDNYPSQAVWKRLTLTLMVITISIFVIINIVTSIHH